MVTRMSGRRRISAGRPPVSRYYIDGATDRTTHSSKKTVASSSRHSNRTQKLYKPCCDTTMLTQQFLIMPAGMQLRACGRIHLFLFLRGAIVRRGNWASKAGGNHATFRCGVCRLSQRPVCANSTTTITTVSGKAQYIRRQLSKYIHVQQGLSRLHYIAAT